MSKSTDLVSNRKALHNFEILDTFEAGIALQGTEIKSLREHGGSLQEAFVDIRGNEAFLINATISPYKFGNIHNHEEKRARKLLLHKSEIEKLRKAIKEKGLALIALAIYLNKKGYAKVKVAIARGRKSHDKRAHLKEKEQKKEIQKGYE